MSKGQDPKATQIKAVTPCELPLRGDRNCCRYKIKYCSRGALSNAAPYAGFYTVLDQHATRISKNLCLVAKAIFKDFISGGEIKIW